MGFLMTYLPIILAGGCVIFLLIGIFRQKKENRKEFASETTRLILATLLSFSIALFSVSSSAKWQVGRETKVVVTRLVFMYGEAEENQGRIRRFRSDYLGGELKDIQYYMLKKGHAHSFFTSQFHYQCSFTLGRSVETVLEDVEPLNNDISLSGGIIHRTLAQKLEKFEGTLASYMRELEAEGRKKGEKIWETQSGARETEKIVKQLPADPG